MPTVKILQTQYQNQLNELDFGILLAHTIGKSKEFLHTHPNYHVSPISYFLFRYFLWRYNRDYSVAAITHHKEFYGLDFYVNKHTLIPRPETELIVDEVAKLLTTTPYSLLPTLLIDVGTGTGCIPIAISATLKQHSNTTPTIFATDISRPALRAAKKNARTHNVFINFLHGYLLEPLIKNYSLLPTPYHLIITANLPYLTAEQFAAEPSIQREPRSALVMGNGGLALYEELLEQIKQMTSDFRPLTSDARDRRLKTEDRNLVVFLEIDPSQSSRITLLIQKYLPSAKIEIKTDLAGRDRVVKISYMLIYQ